MTMNDNGWKRIEQICTRVQKAHLLFEISSITTQFSAAWAPGVCISNNKNKNRRRSNKSKIRGPLGYYQSIGNRGARCMCAAARSWRRHIKFLCQRFQFSNLFLIIIWGDWGKPLETRLARDLIACGLRSGSLVLLQNHIGEDWRLKFRQFVYLVFHH